MDELHASVVRLHAHLFNDLVDQVVLAVPEPAHCFDVCGGSSGLPSGSWIPRDLEKVANAVETGLPIHIEPVVRGEIEGTKCFASLRRTLLKVLVEHLFPTRRVQVGGVRYHTVEVKKDGVVLVAGDRRLLLGCRINRSPVTQGPERTTALAAISSRRGPFQIRTAGISR